jgi:hypothetical protein
MRPRDTHYQTVFGAIPVPAFVVSCDVEILDLNGAAARFCRQNRETAYGHRAGEVLRCLHSTDMSEGCGKGPHCKSCVIRNSVVKCLEGRAVSRKVTNLRLGHEREAKDMKALITASPISAGDEKLALVMVEDITEQHKSVYNISPALPLRGSPMPRQHIVWDSRPRPLREFPADAQLRLRQLDFNRTITVCEGDKALYVRRVGLNQFLCCDA